MFKLLEALDFSHAHGIMHRDVKPLNIVINHEERDLRLIDWGLADFYHPDQEYNVRVASRYYKGPELLVEDKKYHYSLDIWSLGCTLASWFFKIDTFFKGHDNYDQLARINNVMGTSDLTEYMRRYKLDMPSQVAPLISSQPKLPLSSFIRPENKHKVNDAGIDLLERMLVYDKNERILPRDALKHEFFAPIRALRQASQ